MDGSGNRGPAHGTCCMDRTWHPAALAALAAPASGGRTDWCRLAAPSCLVLCRMLRTVPHRDGGFCRKRGPDGGADGSGGHLFSCVEPFLLHLPLETSNKLMLISALLYMNCGLVMVTCNKIKQFPMLVVMFAQLRVAVGQISPETRQERREVNERTTSGRRDGNSLGGCVNPQAFILECHAPTCTTYVIGARDVATLQGLGWRTSDDWLLTRSQAHRTQEWMGQLDSTGHKWGLVGRQRRQEW